MVTGNGTSIPIFALIEKIEMRFRFPSCPAIAKHMTGRAWDAKLSSLRLDSMSIYSGWAGSPQSLATRPCKYVIFDEVEKYPPYSGREADPIRLGIERTTTYIGRRKILITSSPVLRDGVVMRNYEACGDRRVFEVPCPHCGGFQELSYSRVRWPYLEHRQEDLASQIEELKCAFYVCEHCQKPIAEGERWGCIVKGRWRNGQKSSRVGFHISSLYSPWRGWSAIAAEFLRSKDDPSALQNFRNSWLGEPFEIRISQPASDSLRAKMSAELAPPAKVVPSWASVIYATADVQKDHFFFAIRAWGFGLKSQLIHAGMVYTFEELKRVTLESLFPTTAGPMTKCPVLVIDSGGTRTDEVYHFAAQNLGTVFPIKGASHAMTKPWQSTFLTPRELGQSVELRLIDTGYYKDMLSRLMNDPDESKWMLNNECTEDYIRQLSAEHKVLDRKTNRAVWEKITANAANHAFDLEVYQCAAADWGNVGLIPANQPLVAAPNTQRSQNPPPRGSGWLRR